jgi:hypothetical protein
MFSTGSSSDFGTIQTLSIVKEKKVRQKEDRRVKPLRKSSKNKKMKMDREELWPSSLKINQKREKRLRSKLRLMLLLRRRVSSIEESSRFYSISTNSSSFIPGWCKSSLLKSKESTRMSSFGETFFSY